MKTNIYTLVSQDGSDIDEKDYAQPITRPSLSLRWKSVLIATSAFLFASISLNTVLLYRQYITPWKLYDELPSKYGKHITLLLPKNPKTNEQH